MSYVKAEPRRGPATPDKTPPRADPLEGDWSEGLPGPVHAHGLPPPQRLGEPRLAQPAPEQPLRPMETPWSEAVERQADDGWAMAPPATDASSVDWSAPPAQPTNDWAASPPSAPSAADDVWESPAGAPAVTDWAPPDPAQPPPRRLAPSNATPDESAWSAPPPSAGSDLSPEPAAPQFSDATQPEFAPLAPGASLAAQDEEEVPHTVSEDEAASFLRPIGEDEITSALRPVSDDEAASLLRPVGDGDRVPGEHRVAIHTRAGRTRRGSVTDLDLSGSHFALKRQAGGSAEIVAHAELKAIFFMLAPNEAAPAPTGEKIRVTFADGRTIEGHRDGADLRQGFFLVPADAQKTNTKRIYVAKDAVASVTSM